eukprot:SAG31_NODE_439_length_15675_cov_6.578390_7_plen_52_part_00
MMIRRLAFLAGRERRPTTSFQPVSLVLDVIFLLLASRARNAMARMQSVFSQ